MVALSSNEQLAFSAEKQSGKYNNKLHLYSVAWPARSCGEGAVRMTAPNMGDGLGLSAMGSARTRYSISGSLLGGTRERPPSAQSTTRPASSRSNCSIIRPSTPGGSLALHPEVKVHSRPVTQQGMVSIRPAVQGPGRQIMDKSYYLAKLRSKKQELQSEIDNMTEEIDRFHKRAPGFAQLQQRQDVLHQEVKALKTQIRDYNMALEKIESGMELSEIEDAARALQASNDVKRGKLEQLFAKRNLEEEEARRVTEKVKLLEAELEGRFSRESLETREYFMDLKAEKSKLANEVEQLEAELEESSVEKQATKCPLLNTDSAPTSSPFDAREALLNKIRQQNAEIAEVEGHCKVVDIEIKMLQDKIIEANKSLYDMRGGKAEKFIEMQHKEKIMQEFIDNYDLVKQNKENETAQIQQQILACLEQITYDINLNGQFGTGSELMLQSPKDLQARLNEQRLELQQLEELESNVDSETLEIKKNIQTIQQDLETAKQSNSQSQQDVKLLNLEVEKRTLEEQRRLVQLQIQEQKEKINVMKKKLSSSKEMSTSLEDLNKRIVILEETNNRVKEEVEQKERQNSYKPIVENLRFMVGRLNDVIKMTIIS